ncbi:MAG: 1-(5-phosphoribosyl)-5-[(5-phosphoribosylamino) methylideneamino]imidazole-4-carboxamide isomerase [Ktedonobacteraceae bacterium]
MIILPAIDIKDGRCVRLYQGDYAAITTYDADPVQVALRWQFAGASWLHVVDLDGAAQGQPVNLELIGRIRGATTLQIELGGGMRSLTHIKQMLDLGIDRIILGTVALTNRALLEEALAQWGEHIAVGLDARNGLVAIAGWRTTSHMQATTLAAELGASGVRRFIYTDIARDGALKGPNLDALREMQRAIDVGAQFIAPSCSLIASGGVRSINDLRSLVALGIEGAIVGKALYTGDIDLAEAIREIER